MEADLAFRGIDFRDYYRPRGGPSRLTLRRLGVVVRHLPGDSATAKAAGGFGFSQTDLLIMETGMAGPLNPRHPWNEMERAKQSSRAQMLKQRQAYYAARSEGVKSGPDEVPEGHQDDGDHDPE